MGTGFGLEFGFEGKGERKVEVCIVLLNGRNVNDDLRRWTDEGVENLAVSVSIFGSSDCIGYF